MRFASLALLLAAIVSLGHAETPARSGMGINLDTPAYWQSDWPFIDELKRAGGWATRCDSWATPSCRDFAPGASANDTREQGRLDLDADGWPRRLPAADDTQVKYRYVAALLFQGDGGAHPAGRYVVRYDGAGTLGYSGAGRKVDAESRPGRDVLDVTNRPGEGLTLRITRIDPADPLRNVRVIGPGGVCTGGPPGWVADASACATPGAFRSLEDLHATQRVHPAYVADLRGFRVLRFMKWTGANTSRVVHWGQRAKLSDPLWNRAEGVPYEAMFELAAATGADPWITLPVFVDDEYARRFALLARQQLRPGAVLWFEYGNEPWNNAPPYSDAGVWFEQQARARWPTARVAPAQQRLDWYAFRSVQLCRIVKQAFGAEAARVRCVANSQAAAPTVSETMLSCELAQHDLGHRCSRELDALAVAPYFGTDVQPEGDLDALFRAVDGSLDRVKGWIAGSKRVADRHGLPLVAYEGGQHLSTPRGGAADALFLAANRDPRMGAAIERLVGDWKDAGGELFVAFSYTQPPGRGNYWGMKEHQRDETSPKWRAMKALRDAPCWWRGCGS